MPTTAKIARGSVLRPLDDPEACPRVDQLIGRPLTPVPFSPEAGRPDEADGTPLTKFGWQLRETVARRQGMDPAEVPLGLVRQAEALNANTEENLAGLARPVARFTEFGVLWSVPLVVNVPLLIAWIPNGRALRRIAAKIGHEVDVVTHAVDHPTLSLPVMRVHDANQVLDLLETQRELLRLNAYSGDQRDLVDSVASHGILEPPDVVLTQLVSETGSAWTAQTAEGARRIFAAQLGMITISNRDVHSLATAHWHGRNAGLRDLGPADLARLEEALTVPDTAAVSFFPGRDQATWIETIATRQPAAVAWQLMRTARINLVLAVEPNSRTRERFDHPVAATIQELIRRYHVNGKAKENWQQADVDGVAAISLIDTFRDQGRISTEDRAVWLSQRGLEWDSPLGGAGFEANLLTSVVRLIAALTVPGATSAGGVDGVDLVKAVLRDNGVVRPGPFERARMAVAQALVPLRQNGSGHENQVSAALQSLYRDGLLWKTEEHEGGNWTTKLGMPLAALEAEARSELAKRPTVKNPVKELGPAQRALGALGLTALMVNPAMLKGGTAVTRTAKGGGGRSGERISAADPARLLDRMLVDPHGIDQLVDAITALVAGRSPGRPADRETNEELSDRSLRLEWLDEAGTSTEENPAAAYIRMLTELVDRGLATQKKEADRLKKATAATIFNGSEEDPDGEPDNALFDLAKFYETVGIPIDIADRARDHLQDLGEFFAEGKAISRAADRFGR